MTLCAFQKRMVNRFMSNLFDNCFVEFLVWCEVPATQIINNYYCIFAEGGEWKWKSVDGHGWRSFCVRQICEGIIAWEVDLNHGAHLKLLEQSQWQKEITHSCFCSVDQWREEYGRWSLLLDLTHMHFVWFNLLSFHFSTSSCSCSLCTIFVPSIMNTHQLLLGSQCRSLL